MTLSASEVHRLKQAPDVEGVLPVIHERWSPRAFSDRQVSPADLRRVFEAARWAASSSNEQPWRYLVGYRDSDTYKSIYASLVGANKEWAAEAPVLMLGMASTQFHRNGQVNRFALYDLGAATAYLVLQAAALGLAAHQMAGFDPNAAREALAIPEEYSLGSVIALGYQGDPSLLANTRLAEAEVSPRQRKPIREIAYSAWDVPSDLG